MAKAKQCKKCGKWYYSKPYEVSPEIMEDTDLCEECNIELLGEKK